MRYIESLYEQYLDNPQSLDASWKAFFDGMEFSQAIPHEGAATSILPLIDAFRRHGHKAANLSVFCPCDPVPELAPEKYGFSDLSQVVETNGLLGKEQATVAEVIEELSKRYCGTIGYEFMYCDREEVREFILQAIEAGRKELSKEERLKLFESLTKAEGFESFIQKKYQGQKRFSLEGGEPFIPMLEQLLDEAEREGAEEGIIAMAHRGRLNVLANIFGKPYQDIFLEFEPVWQPPFTHVSGDVKYHLGYEATKALKLKLMPNPSHLESINGPLEGWARAAQDAKGKNRKAVLPIIVHGDAAIAGQGIVYEVLQMQGIEGFTTGGTINIIINNHVGFTANDSESRSTRYCSDIAKDFGAPVFHVNADDAESCFFASKLAAQLRQRFGIEVFIELNCYRKYGHNEGDEPRFTNPNMYALIDAKDNPQVAYRKALINSGHATEQELAAIEQGFAQTLESELAKTKERAEHFEKGEDAVLEDNVAGIPTRVPQETLLSLGGAFTQLPAECMCHKKVERIIHDRQAMLEQKDGIDWGLAEHLAFATILAEKRNIRLAGQDSRRGTFAHRHAALINQQTGEAYFPLNHLGVEQGTIEVFNSFLSEVGVLGFEFGYNCFDPSQLTIWEAQYGDFANGAQVMFDQYFSSSEQKWNMKSSLVVLMPHGYEGSGPEHSSGRIERFLQLAACDNIRVVVPSTPAQLFHALRRQVLTTPKPLVMFTPKALLRFKPSLSPLSALSDEDFHTVIPDPEPPTNPKRIMFCSGKVYYDLQPHKERMPTTALCRIEQLYPFDEASVKALLESMPEVTEVIWLQEEPKNMGAWNYIQPLLRRCISDSVQLTYVGRPESASTSAGSMALHNKELEAFLNESFE